MTKAPWRDRAHHSTKWDADHRPGQKPYEADPCHKPYEASLHARRSRLSVTVEKPSPEQFTVAADYIQQVQRQWASATVMAQLARGQLTPHNVSLLKRLRQAGHEGSPAQETALDAIFAWHAQQQAKAGPSL